MYKIFCEVHGGERDYRSGYLKSDGKIAVFQTRKEAQTKADRLNAAHNSNQQRVSQFSYTVDFDC